MGRLRYWDGAAWTDAVAVRQDQRDGGGWVGRHPFATFGIAIGACCALLFAVVAVGVAVGPTEPERGSGAPAAQSDDGTKDAGDTSDESSPKPSDLPENVGDPKGKKRDKPARPEEPPQPEPREYLVTRIVDGDTLELGNGETVRLAGIDTPEVGECGCEESSARLGELVEGREVTLAESDEDRDQYGRLLRYVDLGDVDAGYRLIRDGLAIARYDSRDGYGRHPREDAYIAADQNSPNKKCAPEPRNLVDPGGNCAEGYSPCVPLYPPDVDCPDVNGPVTVTGSDPHGLDADDDGVACEW